MTVLHNTLSGSDLHVAGYVASSDPGAVGSGKVWVDTSFGTGYWQLKIRNAPNDNWEITSTVSTSIISIGDPAADGSWRILVSGVDLVVQRKESGSWVEKGAFLA